MKRTERHHLKENEMQNLARQARVVVEERSRETMGIVALVVVLGVAAVGYYGWHEHVQTKAHGLLAEAMTVQDARVGPPPRLGRRPTGCIFRPNASARSRR
jgi:hypothetical protein